MTLLQHEPLGRRATAPLPRTVWLVDSTSSLIFKLSKSNLNTPYRTSSSRSVPKRPKTSLQTNRMSVSNRAKQADSSTEDSSTEEFVYEEFVYEKLRPSSQDQSPRTNRMSVSTRAKQAASPTEEFVYEKLRPAHVETCPNPFHRYANYWALAACAPLLYRILDYTLPSRPFGAYGVVMTILIQMAGFLLALIDRKVVMTRPQGWKISYMISVVFLGDIARIINSNLSKCPEQARSQHEAVIHLSLALHAWLLLEGPQQSLCVPLENFVFMWWPPLTTRTRTLMTLARRVCIILLSILVRYLVVYCVAVAVYGDACLFCGGWLDFLLGWGNDILFVNRPLEQWSQPKSWFVMFLVFQLMRPIMGASQMVSRQPAPRLVSLMRI